MTEWDVSGWQPRWAPGLDSFADNRQRLRELRERRLTDAWIVWDLEHDRWFPDLPVVLQFSPQEQLEICWQKFDDLSLTWNTIDMATTPEAWVTWPLEWRHGAHPALSSVTGQTVSSVAATEHRLPTSTIWPERGHKQSAWLASGLWLRTDHGGLHVFNALDENGITNDEPVRGDELRLTTI